MPTVQVSDDAQRVIEACRRVQQFIEECRNVSYSPGGEPPAEKARRLAFAICELRLDCAADALMSAADTIAALGGDSRPASIAAAEAYAALRRQPDGRPQFYADLAASPVTVSAPETVPGNPAPAPDTVAG